MLHLQSCSLNLVELKGIKKNKYLGLHIETKEFLLFYTFRSGGIRNTDALQILMHSRPYFNVLRTIMSLHYLLK